MKTILFMLLLSITNLFAHSLIGTWSIDKTKTKVSLTTASSNANERMFIEKLIFNSMKSLECAENHTCIMNEFHNITPKLGKFTWKSDGNNYILLRDKNQFIIQHINASSIKLILTDMTKNKLELYYNKTDATPSKKPSNNLIHIKYNKVYKSKVVDTYLPFSLLSTYFYLVFTDKNKFYSLATTQSDISSTKKIKDLIHKQSDKFKESAKEQLKRLKEMPYTNDTSSIQTISALVGKFSPNKDGIAGNFNTYHKKSDFSKIHNGKSHGIEGKPSRRCTQITFMPNDILSCNNGIEYTLLNTNSTIVDSSIQKNTLKTTKKPIINIDHEAEKLEKKKN